LNERHGPSPERVDVIAAAHHERGARRNGPELKNPDAELGLRRTADSQRRRFYVPHGQLGRHHGKSISRKTQ
jgi:hypothetical protein